MGSVLPKFGTNSSDDMAASTNQHIILTRLTAIRYGAERTNLYELRAADGATLPTFEAGAHIDVFLPNGITRQYSLAYLDPTGSHYTIGVKLDEASRGGSQYMHERLRVGDRIQISTPRNHFPLEKSATHTVLIAGGIGITPIRCMIQQLKQLGKSWELHYSVRKREEGVFLDELELNSDRVHIHVDEEKGSYMPIRNVVSSVVPGAHFYCCGPQPMLEAFKQACEALPPENVHFEYFGVQQPVPTGNSFMVRLARSGKELFIPAGTTILDVLAEQGLEVPSSCRQGVCGMCETRVLEGVPDHRDVILTDAERKSNKTMMICCSGCKGDRLVLDL